MALAYVNDTLTGSGSRLTMATGDALTIGQAGFVVSTDFNAVDGWGGNTVFVKGSAFGESLGVVLGASLSSTLLNRVTVDQGAAVWGGAGGISLIGQSSRITNLGTISSDYTAVKVAAQGSGLSYIHNEGVIDGSTYGISRTGSESAAIYNEGTIRGLTAALHQQSSVGQTGALHVTNAGKIIGDILGGNGNDTYRSTAEGALFGLFNGGGGNDSFTSGTAAETFDGDSGIDTADYSKRAGVILFLDGQTEGEGGALDDLLIRIENVIGSRLGADRIYGYGENNRLEGRGGADALSGGAGNDVLVGGAAADTLTGGSGNDVFIFTSLFDVGDKIVDFSSSAAGNNDAYHFRSAAFGGLSLGALAASRFRARADNVAQDADDRFIFRTTDKTLWFDANGKTAGGLTMILDHVGLSNMTHQDIFII